MRHYYLGLAAKMGFFDVLRHTFAFGSEKSRAELSIYLSRHYGGEAQLTKNGRTALALALGRLCQPGESVLANGFTCYAVYEAVRAASVKPVWADIDAKDLNFTTATLEKALKTAKSNVTAIIVQNTLGHPVDMAKIEQFCKKHKLAIIEDLAHSVGVKYPDGREAGTVGAATILSFGKEKAVDATSGGAVVFRGTTSGTPHLASTSGPNKSHTASDATSSALHLASPTKEPRFSDRLRSRFYPLFAITARTLSYIHLSGAWMRLLTTIHWVEKSADSRLDFTRKISKTEAKLALQALKALPKGGARPLRDFVLVKNRAAALTALRQKGYFFDGLWYETPVAPARHYKKVHFPEKDCPVATEVAKTIVNLPTYYSKQALAPARAILERYQMEARP